MSKAIEKIYLRSLLPYVFKGMENSPEISASSIWNKEQYVIERGCKLCIKSKSGGGKSSLLSYIYGNRTDYHGTICFDETDIRTYGIKQWCEMRTYHLSLLPQEMRLFAELTVMQNIEIKNNRTGYKTQSQIEGYLDRLGIADKRDVSVATLSIGQQQRVAIVRALCQPFDFIFLDEPVSHLDSHNNAIVASIIEEEAARQGAGIIATSVGNNLLLHNAQFISL